MNYNKIHQLYFYNLLNARVLLHPVEGGKGGLGGGEKGRAGHQEQDGDEHDNTVAVHKGLITLFLCIKGTKRAKGQSYLLVRLSSKRRFMELELGGGSST